MKHADLRSGTLVELLTDRPTRRSYYNKGTVMMLLKPIFVFDFIYWEILIGEKVDEILVEGMGYHCDQMFKACDTEEW